VSDRKSMEPYLKDEVAFYDHQVEGIRKMMRMKSVLLADDMGLGKSIQALTVFVGDVIQGKGSTAIIVCPVSLRGNWADEIVKFTRIPYMLLGEEINPTNGKVRSLGPRDRTRQIVEFSLWNRPKILILNYEQVDAHLGELNALDVRMAIFDEAHMIKNPESKRTKACLALKAERSLMLTGTPILNKVVELWPLFNRIAPTFFPNFYAFRNRYCVMGGYKNKQITGTKNTKQLHDILSQIMIRRLKSEVLDLPEVQYIKVPVPLHPEQQRLYDQANEEFMMTDPGGPAYDLNDDMLRFMRLLQLCDTPATIGYADNSYKLDTVVDKAMELITSGEKVVVFTRFRPVVACLEERFAKVGVTTRSLHGDITPPQRDANAAYIANLSHGAVLLCMSQVAGIGLNFTWARYGFRVDRLFVPGLNQQVVDRLHRIGADKTQPVTILDFISRGTTEQKVEDINRAKTKLSNDVIDNDDINVIREMMRMLRGK
jgi:SNF2 family DNA or RNA helicase